MDKETGSQVNIRIAEDVFIKIVIKEVLSVPGVHTMSATGLGEKLAKKQEERGVRVSLEDDIVSVDIHIIVEFESRIPDVAFKIQEKVKSALEEKTGYTVASVNIHVDAIHFPEEEN